MKLPFRKKDTAPVEPETSEERVERERKKGKFKNISSTLLLIVTAPLLAIFITSHVFHSYEVDGMSMDTTLQNGDRLIVFKLPKTVSNITGGTHMPSRWDVIVFDRPGQLSRSNSVRHLIKRVIALPGERVTVADGVVTVYNDENPDGFMPDDGQEYFVSIDQTPGKVDITVDEGEVFVLGDNRTNSTDSRSFGAISTDLVVGKATARFVPVNNMKRL